MPTVNLFEKLEKLYRDLDANKDGEQQDSTHFSLCRRGRDLWRQWWDEIEALKDDELNPFLRAIYPKALERAGRIALVAHCINCASANQPAGDVIPAQTLEWAIAFVRWTLQQAKAIYGDCGHAESPEAQRIARFVQRFRGKTVDGRRVNAWWTGGKKPLAKECRQFLGDLVALGYAEVITGNRDQANFTVRISGAKVHNAYNPHYDGDTGAPTQGAFQVHEVHSGDGRRENAPDAPMFAPAQGAPETPTGSQFQANAPNAPDFVDKKFQPGDLVRYVGRDPELLKELPGAVP